MTTGGQKEMEKQLQDIIQTDHMARDIVQKAQETCDEIAAQTKAEIQEVVKECEARSAETTQLVAEEQQTLLEQQLAQVKAEFAQKRDMLQKTVEQNRDKWVDNMVEAILQAKA